MADGLLEGVLGGEEEKIDPTVGGTEPIVAAVAANLASQSPEFAAKAAAMFEQQTRLLRLQCKNVEAEYDHFESEAGPRLLALRLRTGFQLFLALIATVIGLGLAVVVYSAMQSRGVVIEPFDIAPNIAAEVPSGRIVAAGLLDVLTKIQAASRSGIEHRNLSNAWTKEISIDVPETGISIGDLERMVKTRFGHDLHIEGNLVQTRKGGLALTVRGNGVLPNTFTDLTGDLDSLLNQAGEYVFGQSQPGLFAAYLTNNDRDDDAIHFAQVAYVTADASERPYVLNYWANAISGKGREGAMREALPLWREAVRLKPDYWQGFNNIMYGLAGLGDEEGAVRVGKQMMELAGGRPGRAPELMYQNYDGTVWDLPAARASNIADIESHSGIGTNGAAVGPENLGVAQTEVQMHDVESAALRLKTTPIDERNVPDVGSAAFDRALLAAEIGDFEAAAKEWDVFAAAYANPTVSTSNPNLICFAALSYEKTGRSAKAEAALKPFGNGTYVDCYRFKGDVLDLRGDWIGAQEWYAKAVTLGPSIPSGYYSWGLALAKHGDFAEAAAKFQLANQKGPHWADPLKAWGDVLMKQNQSKDALAKYDEALKYAPNWKQLKEARDAAAKQKDVT